MATLIRWRGARRRGAAVDLAKAKTFARISDAQLGLLTVMIFLATAITRGLGG